MRTRSSVTAAVSVIGALSDRGVEDGVAETSETSRTSVWKVGRQLETLRELVTAARAMPGASTFRWSWSWSAAPGLGTSRSLEVPSIIVGDGPSTNGRFLVGAGDLKDRPATGLRAGSG